MFGLFAIEKIARLSLAGLSAEQIQGLMEIPYPTSLIEMYMPIKTKVKHEDDGVWIMQTRKNKTGMFAHRIG